MSTRLEHVKETMKLHPELRLKEILKKAKKTYKKTVGKLKPIIKKAHKKTAHKKTAHKKTAHKKTAHKKTAHKKTAHKKTAHKKTQKKSKK